MSRTSRKTDEVRGVSARTDADLARAAREALECDVVRRAIESALKRHVEREARRFYLDIADGRVMVRGVVGSNGEREAVLGAIRGTPGVTSVEDKLRIKPFSIRGAP